MTGKPCASACRLSAAVKALSDDVIQKIKKFRAMMVTQIEEILKLGQEDKSITGITDPTSESRAVLALLEGAHLTARAEENVNTFDEALGVLKSRC